MLRKKYDAVKYTLENGSPYDKLCLAVTLDQKIDQSLIEELMTQMNVEGATIELNIDKRYRTALALSDSIGCKRIMNNHKDVKTTLIYTHVINNGEMGIRSPADII